MSEADTPETSGGPLRPDPAGTAARTRVTRTTSGVVIRWEAPTADMLADAFPGLKVRALCGVGGMGAVYRAEQARLGRTVAVKILPSGATPDEEAKERFVREARILSGLNHPHVLSLHDFGALPDGTLYLVMEWAGGGDLAKLMGGRAHPPALVREWVRQIAAALGAAHARGVIHRDLKPANVLVLEDGRLTLADFGLAHAAGGGFTAPLTGTGAIFGTFEYMAPEQMESADKVTPATDLYALGVMTYQMLTGRVPRGAYPKPSRLSRVPSEVDVFIDSAMANDAARRPGDAAEFARLFEYACDAPVRRRRRQLIGLGITLIIFTLAWARSEIIRAEREAARFEASATGVANALRAARRAETTVRRSSLRPPPDSSMAVPDFEGAFDSPAPLVIVDPITPATANPSAPAVGFPGAETPPQAMESGAPGKKAPSAVDRSSKAGSETPVVPWTWILPGLEIADHILGGEWRLTGGELVSGEGCCVFVLPVKLALNYDIAVEFTRDSGKNSVALFLPTLSGVGAFEVDAWDQGIAGLQLIDGLDMRRQNRYFPARLENGDMHRLIVEVRGDKVAATWDGQPRMIWALAQKSLRIPPLWQAKPDVGLAVGSWMSPTTFHRIAYRAWPADFEQ